MTLQEIRNLLRIVKNRLDDELEIQAQVAEVIGTEVAKLNARLVEAKEKLNQVEAELYLDLRGDATQKITVEQRKAEITLQPTRISAWQAMARAQFDLEQWQKEETAWKERGYALTNLCNLYGHDYFSQTHTGHTVTRRPERDNTVIADAIRQHTENRRERVRVS